MPAETGAKSGVQSLGDTMAQIQKMVADSVGRVQQKMLAQGAKMAKDLEANGDLVVKKMDDQHQEAMTQFNDLLGNERAGDEQSGQ